MDLRLPLLADINLHLGVAEEAIAEGDLLLARLQLEKAEESFAELNLESPEALFQALLSPLQERAKGVREDLRAQAPRPNESYQSEKSNKE